VKKTLTAHSLEAGLDVVVQAVEHPERLVDGRRIGRVQGFEDTFAQRDVAGHGLVSEARRHREHVSEDAQRDFLGKRKKHRELAHNEIGAMRRKITDSDVTQKKEMKHEGGIAVN
jgi:hypothetical protein